MGEVIGGSGAVIGGGGEVERLVEMLLGKVEVKKLLREVGKWRRWGRWGGGEVEMLLGGGDVMGVRWRSN